MPYNEYNFIGRKGNQCQAYWVIHGCPRGHKTNIKNENSFTISTNGLNLTKTKEEADANSDKITGVVSL